jgi:hypothetical protein
MFSMMLSQLVVTCALPAREARHMVSMCIVTVDYILVFGKGHALQRITKL